MSFRRLLALAAAVVATLILAIVLYLALADLGRHRGLVEDLVARQTNRAFTIGGAFELEVLPSVSVVAEDVRLANAEWGSEPSMVTIGRLATEVGLWSLVSGPIHVRSLELSDVSVLLEKDPDGEANWVLGDEGEPEETEEDPLDARVTGLPAVIEEGQLRNVRITYREADKKDRVAALETLSIASEEDGPLTVSAKGRLNEYPAGLTGELGTVDALISGRDIQVAVEGSVGNLRLNVDGSLGRLHPLGGADLTLGLENPDLGTMLENLELPAVATGALGIDARLKDAGDRTRVDVKGRLGDIELKTEGTLRVLGLPGSDLEFEVSVPDAARLAAVFDVTGLPAGGLEIRGHLSSSPEELRLEGMTATLAGTEARLDGTLKRTDRETTARFGVTAESLARLREGLPEIPFQVNGSYTGHRDGFELEGVEARLGDSEISGRASMAGRDRKRVDVELRSAHLDLTPFMKRKAEDKDAEAGSSGALGATPAEAGAAEPEAGARDEPTAGEETASGEASAESGSEEPAPGEEYVFGEEPLPLDSLGKMDMEVRLGFAEVELGAGLLRDVDSTLTIAEGGLQFEARAKGALEGTIDGSVRLTPSSDGADLSVRAAVQKLRAGLMAGDDVERSEAPLSNLEIELQASGASPRQMAAGANGRLLATSGPGTIDSGLIDMFGAGILGQLAGKLNPFAAEDPHTQLECTVARVDIVDGQLTVKPVVMQSEKVTVTAAGKVDLPTEKLDFDFNTRPRKGIGISAGMFTNPFIKLGGTLAQPRLGVGAKGVGSGALAAATAGISVLAKGLVDRVAGEMDVCESTLAEAMEDGTPSGEE